MSNLFQKVQYDAFRAGITPRSRESRAWFRKRVQNLKVNRRELMSSEPIEKKSSSIVGNMYMFFYDAKLRESLPYWDSFPLIIAMGPAKGGIYGMNLHYLPIPLRAKFLDNLMEITNNKRFDESTKFEVSYQMMKSASKMRYFKPCFKHYLTTQIEGQFAYIPPPEWEIATFLPTAQWNKANQSTVYKNSRGMI